MTDGRMTDGGMTDGRMTSNLFDKKMILNNNFFSKNAKQSKGYS